MSYTTFTDTHKILISYPQRPDLWNSNDTNYLVVMQCGW